MATTVTILVLLFLPVLQLYTTQRIQTILVLLFLPVLQLYTTQRIQCILRRGVTSRELR
jgi:hypothetical protein